MGLPQAPNDIQRTTMDAQPRPSIRTPIVKDVSDLPPEAIALASKVFNFAREGKTAELSQYVSAGVSVNLTNHEGNTLLMLASYNGHVQTVEMLLAKGAHVNELNERGQSPLAGAVFKGHDDVVETLVDAGADVYAGHPNAVDSARMFKKEEYLRMFEDNAP